MEDRSRSQSFKFWAKDRTGPDLQALAKIRCTIYGWDMQSYEICKFDILTTSSLPPTPKKY